MMKINRNLKKLLGLGFCVLVVVGFLIMGVQGKSGDIPGTKPTGCDCHIDTTDPSVIITVTGLPVEYVPSTTYPLTITVSGGAPGTEGGFNLDVTGGTLSSSDPNCSCSRFWGC
jgi:hypothetical protein